MWDAAANFASWRRHLERGVLAELQAAFQLAEFMGFTETEVQDLCQRFPVDFEEIRRWYDGYRLDNGLHVYSPCSVVQALRTGECENFWTSTESFASLRQWLSLDFEGLRSAVVDLLDGESLPVDKNCFNNSFSDLDSRDAVLVLLVHLGYLGYKKETCEVFVPNLEIACELSSALKGTGWREIAGDLR